MKCVNHDVLLLTSAMPHEFHDPFMSKSSRCRSGFEELRGLTLVGPQ